MSDIEVYRNRTNRLPITLGFNITGDTLSSEIREGKTHTSPLIATWTVNVVDAVAGEILLTLDDSALSSVTQKAGYMDIKRVSGGEPLPVFKEPVKVVFKDVVTA